MSRTPARLLQGLYGTTPPIHNRSIKMARKGHKHKSSKKLCVGNYSKDACRVKPELKRKPQSMIALATSGKPPEEGSGPRRHTIHEVRGEKEVSRRERRVRVSGGSESGDGGGKTPGSGAREQGEEKASRRRRKQESKRRKKNRDDKVSLDETPASATLAPPKTRFHESHSVDVPDFAGFLPLNGSDESFLTSSLQPGLLYRSTPSSPRQRVRRSKSDAHITIGADDQNIHCPPERKQFYRHFVRALKYSGITQAPLPRFDSPAGPRVSRLYSENLTLGNPLSYMYEQIWLELQAFFNDKSLEGQKEDLFYKMEYVDKVLTRILNFKLPLQDPEQSLNSMFFGTTPSMDYNKDEYEPMGPLSLESNSTLHDTAGEGKEEATGVVVADGTSARGMVCDFDSLLQQDSVESKSSEESLCQCTPDRFLSTHQIFALSKVHTLLWELEVAESYFSNRRSMGDKHTKYRTPMYRRREQALVLWEKVVKGLSDRLCSLSSWLRVPVVIPDICREPKPRPRTTSLDRPRSRATSFDKPPSPSGRIRSDSDPSAALSSPKSPLARFHFQVGSPDSPKDDLEQPAAKPQVNRLTSDVSRSSTSGSYRSQTTLQRLFSVYQSVSLEEYRGPYRLFVDRGLKKRGLARLMDSLLAYVDPVLSLAQYALTPLSEQELEEMEEEEEERRPLLRALLPPALTSNDSYHPRAQKAIYNRSTSTGPECWVTEFEAMDLPLFGSQYIQLLHVPLDVMHECLRLQIELRRPQQPSPHSVKQVCAGLAGFFRPDAPLSPSVGSRVSGDAREGHSGEEVLSGQDRGGGQWQPGPSGAGGCRH